MPEEAGGNPLENAAYCVVCRESIKVGARKCIHCDSYQDFRHFFGVSLTFFSMLLAFLSVGGLIATSIARIPKSETLVQVIKVETRLFEGIESTYVRLAIQNRGYAPSMVGNIVVRYESGNEATHSLANPSYYNIERTTGHHPDKSPALPVLMDPETISIVEVVFEGRPIQVEMASCRVEFTVSSMDSARSHALLCGMNP